MNHRAIPRGNVAVITGGAGGIGLAAAKRRLSEIEPTRHRLTECE